MAGFFFRFSPLDPCYFLVIFLQWHSSTLEHCLNYMVINDSRASNEPFRSISGGLSKMSPTKADLQHGGTRSAFCSPLLFRVALIYAAVSEGMTCVLTRCCNTRHDLAAGYQHHGSTHSDVNWSTTDAAAALARRACHAVVSETSVAVVDLSR